MRKIMFLGSRSRPVCKDDNVTATCEPIGILNMTTLQASPACYGDSFTLSRRSVLPVRYNWTVSTATSSQYLAFNCEPIV
jgi:hypothetical protein